MEETGKAGKKSNIEINADKGAKQNSHPGREDNGPCACIPDESCHAVAGKML